MIGNVIETTKEQDFASYTKLFDYNPDTVSMVQLNYGQYAEDFPMANGYRVNLETLNLEFSYPDLTEPEAPPVIRKPLTEELDELTV